MNIIFDMDGTVLNTIEDLTVSMNHALTKFNMPERTVEEFRSFFGSGARVAMERAVPAGTPSETIDRMMPVFKEHYDVHCLDRTRPYDGIPELMRQLQNRGCKMAIVSNKIDSAVKELNERFFSGLIDVAIGERPGIKRKPAPDTVFEAIKELGSSKSDAVYVGDSEVDLETGQRAGMDVISVLWGFRDREDLEKAGAVRLVRTPEELFRTVLCDEM